MENKIIIISGGANGLGLELVKQLVNKNYVVCNVDWDTEALDNVNKEFNKNLNYTSYLGDISNEEFVKATVEDIAKRGEIACLINNAGEPSFKATTENCKEDLNIVFRGLYGMIYLSTQVLKHIDKTGGKIINILSSAALRGNSEESAYCAAKWGERGYTESLKSAYKGTEVRVMGVYPGGIDTSNFYKNNRHYVSEKKQKTFMPPSDVAKVIIDNAFINANLFVSDLIIERNTL